MKNLILLLALLSSVFLNAQKGQKTPNSNNTKPTQPQTINHPVNSSFSLNAQTGQKAPNTNNTNSNNTKPIQPQKVSHSISTPMPGGGRDKESHRKRGSFRVVYIMKDEPTRFRYFKTRPPAEAFRNELLRNPNCISCYIEDVI